MDSQDVAYDDISQERFDTEMVRIHNMCDWTKKSSVGGLVRF